MFGDRVSRNGRKGTPPSCTDLILLGDELIQIPKAVKTSPSQLFEVKITPPPVANPEQNQGQIQDGAEDVTLWGRYQLRLFARKGNIFELQVTEQPFCHWICPL